MTSAQYHQIIVALDAVLEDFAVPAADLFLDDARVCHDLRMIRAKLLRAESGHTFPVQVPEMTNLRQPAEQEERSFERSLAQPANSSVAAHIRTLIVDDQESVRTVARLLLQSVPDIDVVGEAANGMEAVELVGLHRPDIVLMDVNMPVLDGLSATKRILGSHPETKVIIFSANRSSAYIGKAAEIGAAGYLAKPASRNELVKMVREVYQAGRQKADQPEVAVHRPGEA